jgi:hypothetical protein
MNCSECQAQLAELSAEALASEQSLAMRAHFEECAHCYGEWAIFERTLFLISSVEQPLPSPLASEQMWHRCAEHIFQKVEAERLNPRREYSRQEEVLRDSGAAESRGWRGWLARQPRWSWASLAGAFVVFGAVWFLAPGDATSADGGREGLAPESELVMLPTPVPSQALSTPPTGAAALVNHHTGMTVDPFTDYVGNTMVSYSATAAPVDAVPVDAAPVDAAPVGALPRR